MNAINNNPTVQTLSLDVTGYEDELKKNIKSKIAYLSEDIVGISDEANAILVSYEPNDSELPEKIESAAKKAVEDYRHYRADVLFTNDPETEFPEIDIYDEMVKRKWIIHYENGLIGFGKEFLALYKKLDNLFLEWAAEYSADEYTYPDLISIDTLNKFKYISQFPNHIMFASHLQKDLTKIEQFSEEIKHSNECLNDHYMAKPSLINKTAVCNHVYAQYQDQVIDPDKPVVITSVGRCKRYESLNMKTAERLMDFNMREIVFLGPAEFVIKSRDELIKKAEQLLLDWGLKSNIQTGNDPFFTSEFSKKAYMQKRLNRKYELNVYLPQAQKDLAVGSFNFHDTYFTDTFNIQSTDEERSIQTGCVAFGMERFIYAYLCQKGLDADHKL